LAGLARLASSFLQQYREFAHNPCGCLNASALRVPVFAGLFDDASFKLNGNLFWPDFWPPGTSQEAQDVVYDMVGLEADRAWVSSCQ
jgi:hypothetical protein